MQFLVDKYNPKNKDDIFDDMYLSRDGKIKDDNIDTDDAWIYSDDPKKCFFHKPLFSKLKSISTDDSMPHIIFYGNKGTGKKTMINIFLEMIFDESIYKLDESKYIVYSSGNNENEVLIKQSDHHIIIEPNNTNFDRHLIQEIVKEYAKKVPLHIFEKNKMFKVVQINNLDNLSYYAQTSLRRTVEKYSKTCRFVMWCYSLSKVIEPLRSRCLCIHVPTQSDDNLIRWIYNIVVLEKIKIRPQLVGEIIEQSNGNLKSILWKLDLYKHCKKINNSYDFGLNVLINEIMTLADKSAIVTINVPQIREYIYKLYITNVSSNTIIKDILKQLLIININIDSTKISEIINYASEFEYRLSKKRRDILHIEAFIIKVIDILRLE
jgi:replication factor C subunit 3/5